MCNDFFICRWTPASGAPTPQMSQSSTDGPEPRILSKKRRDLINAEIRELQNLLPLKKSSRERLSYLGILALTNTFIRKATFFKKGKPQYFGRPKILRMNFECDFKFHCFALLNLQILQKNTHFCNWRYFSLKFTRFFRV